MTNAVFVLPVIDDAADEATKNVTAIRNACLVEGRCPECGVVGVLGADPNYDGIYHLTFEHEAWCRALTDEAAS
jgi:hypothetical protein